MTRPQRKLIPDEQTIVVLDTSPVRNIGHDGVPAWVATFADMAKNGYSFSLADGACVELLTAHARGSITDHELATIISAAETYLNPAVPVLLGKVDLMRMIGESSAPSGWEAEALTLSQRAWQVLKAASSTSPEERIGGEDELQEDRDDWIDAFKKFDAAHAEWLSKYPDGEAEHPLNEYEHPALDAALDHLAAGSQTPPPTMAERQDLQMRYIWRQWVRTRKEKHAYDPSSPKKVNDGIDLDLYRYLMLPALVVADDGGFHQRIADIKSPQREWFWRPQALADAWTRGERPRPAWAAAVTDPAASQTVA